MKLTSNAVLSLAIIFSLSWVRLVNAVPPQIKIVGPRQDVNFGTLINAPNGHISFEKRPHGYRIWVPGRLKDSSQNINEEGGFSFDVKNWSYDTLAAAQPTYMDIGHVADNCDPNDFSFDRNYAAPNAVVPGAGGHTLLAFYDAEYHVACPSGQPLLSSIGLATSSNGGVTWTTQGQVMQGLDQGRKGFTYVTQQQLAAYLNGGNLDSGASGPSAVIREADFGIYIYLYYGDRTPITGGRDSIYVARALLSTNGMPGNWQQWTGNGWGSLGDQTSAAPVVVPSNTARSALQPHVSWNTALHRWLMVFHAKGDFEVSTSVDGVNWTPASSLLPFDTTNDGETAFPTLISLNEKVCTAFGCAQEKASQQVTGASGWLYFSSRPLNENQYFGHRAPFRIVR